MPLEAPTTKRVVPRGSNSPSSSEAVDSCIAQVAAACGQGSRVLLSCDHSLEGVMAGVGLAYLAHAPAESLRLCSDAHAQPMLDEAVCQCPSVANPGVLALAQRVYAGLEAAVSAGCGRLRNGECPTSCEAACVNKLCYACAADDARMPEAVHRYARLAFRERGHTRLLMAYPEVVALDELARYTLNECEKTRQFLRFQKLSDGSFMATFRPRANTLPLVSHHFANRMLEDRFCMVDPVHLVAVLHRERRRTCSVVRIDAELAQQFQARGDLAEDELRIQAMWRQFYQALALPGRDASQRGYDLRVKWMPKRFWQGLPEVQPA